MKKKKKNNGTFCKLHLTWMVVTKALIPMRNIYKKNALMKDRRMLTTLDTKIKKIK